MSKYGERAARLNSEGYNCAQSVFCAFAEQQGMDMATAAAISGNLGTGCREGCTCGAVCGGLMALGFYCGHRVAGDMDAKKRSAEVSAEYLKRFRGSEGSTQCREILGGNPSVPEDRRRLSSEHKFSTVCRRVTIRAAEILEEYVKELENHGY